MSNMAELIAPRPGDAHPSSGLGRVVVHLILFEIGKLAEQFQLAPLDDVDEERYVRALSPLLKAMRDEFAPHNLRPRSKELSQVRAGIREFERWRRKPSEEELRGIVDKAMGIVRTQVSGADMQARRVFRPGSLPAIPAASDEDREPPAWLPELAQAVGGNELMAKTFIVPLLNMDEASARRAIAKIREGREAARARVDREEERAKRETRAKRASFTSRCLSQVLGQMRASRAEQGAQETPQ